MPRTPGTVVPNNPADRRQGLVNALQGRIGGGGGITGMGGGMIRLLSQVPPGTLDLGIGHTGFGPGGPAAIPGHSRRAAEQLPGSAGMGGNTSYLYASRWWRPCAAHQPDWWSAGCRRVRVAGASARTVPRHGRPAWYWVYRGKGGGSLTPLTNRHRQAPRQPSAAGGAKKPNWKSPMTLRFGSPRTGRDPLMPTVNELEAKPRHPQWRARRRRRRQTSTTRPSDTKDDAQKIYSAAWWLRQIERHEKTFEQWTRRSEKLLKMYVKQSKMHERGRHRAAPLRHALRQHGSA